MQLLDVARNKNTSLIWNLGSVNTLTCLHASHQEVVYVRIDFASRTGKALLRIIGAWLYCTSKNCERLGSWPIGESIAGVAKMAIPSADNNFVQDIDWLQQDCS